MLMGDCGLRFANGTLGAACSAPLASPASSEPAAARYTPSRKKRRRSGCETASSAMLTIMGSRPGAVNVTRVQSLLHWAQRVDIARDLESQHPASQAGRNERTPLVLEPAVPDHRDRHR